MARLALSRINSAHVLAAIALFAALGGGYAVAFKGSGTLQKAGKLGLSPSFENVRTLKGFGTLKARCDGSQNEVEYRIENTSPYAINWMASRMPNPQFHQGTVGQEDEQTIGIGSGATGATMRIHLTRFTTPAQDRARKAQVDITASNDGPHDGNCGTVDLWVLALNTQE